MRTLPALLLVAAALLAACGGSDTSGSGASGGTNVATYSQSGSTVTTKVGQQFVIALDANLSTGYSWQLAQPPGDRLKLIDADYVNQGSVPGASGTQQFEFEATSSGSTTLSFAYGRPWEQGVPPAKTAGFPVTVS